VLGNAWAWDLQTTRQGQGGSNGKSLIAELQVRQTLKRNWNWVRPQLFCAQAASSASIISVMICSKVVPAANGGVAWLWQHCPPDGADRLAGKFWILLYVSTPVQIRDPEGDFHNFLHAVKPAGGENKISAGSCCNASHIPRT